LILLSAVAMTASPQSSKGPSTPAVAPKVRPAFPQEQVPANQQQDAASREKAEADKARREAQAQEERRLAQETQARGYWVDPSTGLMWEGKDNGIAVTWRKAASYCRNLRLAGHTDWRLATLDELAGLVDKSASTPERVGSTETFSINLGNVGGHVRGACHCLAILGAAAGTRIVSGILTGMGISSTSSLLNPQGTCPIFATPSSHFVCAVRENDESPIGSYARGCGRVTAKPEITSQGSKVRVGDHPLRTSKRDTALRQTIG
jgi:hypothetical protein